MKKDCRKKSSSGKYLFWGILTICTIAACKRNNVEEAIIKEGIPKTTSVVQAAAITPSDADAAINAYNNAFLVTSGGNTFYKSALNNGTPDGFWTLALSIQGMQDAYERTGTAAHRTLVHNLSTSYLQIHPPPYDWDGWNDDIAWVGLMLARGHQMTGTANLRTQAEYCFNFIYNRGWDTQYNGGGIWEQQPNMVPDGAEIIKEALSNNPTGKLACMLFQITGNTTYHDKAIQIYTWSRSRLFNAATGEVYRGIYRDNSLSISPAVYNQGAFIDFAAYLHKITGNVEYLNDAIKAVDYVRNNMTTGGIISNTNANLNTWADEYARGLGHLCKWNPQLWNTYHSFMLANTNAILNNRRTDLNLTWNGWAQATPINSSALPTHYVSALAMLQFTPAINPASGSLANGTYKIINRASGLALDAAGGGTANGTALIQYGYNGGNNQRWILTGLGNRQYSLRNVGSGRSIDVNAASVVPGTAAILYDYQGSSNQKVTLGSPASGYYSLFFQHDYQVLDVSANSTSPSAAILQWGYNGGSNQQWQFLEP
jgi:predicted alpha-1,6-mannanase (GH76 family)